MPEKKSESLQRVAKEDRPKIRTTLPELYRAVDLDGVIVDCNEDYACRLGYTVDEAIGMSIFEHTPDNDQKRLDNILDAWKKTGEALNRKVKLNTVQNNTFDVLLTATNRYDRDGRLVGGIHILRDISELKKLQDLVKIRKYESLYEESPDLYRTVNYAGIIIACNRSYENKMGYTKDEIIGTNLLEHTSDKSVSNMRVNMANWRNTGKGKTTEVWMKRKDGTEFPALLTPTNLYDDDGALIGRNVVIKDSTELHNTKQVLDEREKIDKMKEEFLSVVTHELKSPLTPIIGFSQVLSKPKMLGDLNQKQMDAVNTILANATRLRRLIVDLLDAHKLELGRMHFTYRDLAVADLLDGIQLSFAYTAQEKNITIESDVTTDIGSITGDRDRIEQVITNLVYNAIDFVPKDTGRIRVLAQKNDGLVRFVVEDNGVGIPKEKQKNLFSKFYQADTSATRKHGGTGLGLSICKGIVENMGGTIGVESEENVGSKFYFTVPVSRDAHEDS